MTNGVKKLMLMLWIQGKIQVVVNNSAKYVNIRIDYGKDRKSTEDKKN